MNNKGVSVPEMGTTVYSRAGTAKDAPSKKLTSDETLNALYDDLEMKDEPQLVIEKLDEGDKEGSHDNLVPGMLANPQMAALFQQNPNLYN